MIPISIIIGLQNGKVLNQLTNFGSQNLSRFMRRIYCHLHNSSLEFRYLRFDIRLLQVNGQSQSLYWPLLSIWITNLTVFLPISSTSASKFEFIVRIDRNGQDPVKYGRHILAVYLLEYGQSGEILSNAFEISLFF